jgi:hypothetical protein
VQHDHLQPFERPQPAVCPAWMRPLCV